MKPLGLPAGSVRAIIIISLTSAIVIPVFVFMFRSTDIPPNIEKFLTGLVIALVGLIKDYVSQRNGEQLPSLTATNGNGG